jgi:hypothetical protein
MIDDEPLIKKPLPGRQWLDEININQYLFHHHADVEHP